MFVRGVGTQDTYVHRDQAEVVHWHTHCPTETSLDCTGSCMHTASHRAALALIRCTGSFDHEPALAHASQRYSDEEGTLAF